MPAKLPPKCILHLRERRLARPIKLWYTGAGQKTCARPTACLRQKGLWDGRLGQSGSALACAQHRARCTLLPRNDRRKTMVTAVLLLVVLVLPWPTLSLIATAPGGNTAESASLVVPADNEAQYPPRPAFENPGRPCQRRVLATEKNRRVR
jgi:hypothetical protein